MIYFFLVLIVILDQVSKQLAIKYLKGRDGLIIIEDFFRLYYVENSGAAFGILQNRKIFFIVITSLVILGIAFFLIRFSYSINFFFKLGLIFLLGGSIGNFIDRVKQGYVVDFISFKFGKAYAFPVFNIADIFIVVGTGLIMLLVIMDYYEN